MCSGSGSNFCQFTYHGKLLKFIVHHIIDSDYSTVLNVSLVVAVITKESVLPNSQLQDYAHVQTCHVTASWPPPLGVLLPPSGVTAADLISKKV